MRQPNVVMTGATGFIGRRLRAELFDRGFQVRATSRMGGSAVEAMDLTSGSSPIIELLRDARADVVLHLAAAGVGGVREQVAPLVAVNVLGTAHLLDAAVEVGVHRFVHVSSELAADESDPYGVTKHAAELVVQHAAANRGIDAINLRLPVIFGPGEPSTKLIPRLLEAAVQGEPVALRTPERTRGFLHVDDAADAIIHAIDTGASGRTWHVPSAGRCTLAMLQDLVRDAVSGEAVFSHPDTFVPDGALPGWRPTIRLQDGLRLSIDGDTTSERRART